MLVGDLDSLSAVDAAVMIASGMPVITAPAAKDETDPELTEIIGSLSAPPPVTDRTPRVSVAGV